MTNQNLFGLPLIDICPCGEAVGNDHQHLVFDTISDVWHRVCDKCLRGEALQVVN